MTRQIFVHESTVHIKGIKRFAELEIWVLDESILCILRVGVWVSILECHSTCACSQMKFAQRLYAFLTNDIVHVKWQLASDADLKIKRYLVSCSGYILAH